jgi:hypothetical protein
MARRGDASMRQVLDDLKSVSLHPPRPACVPDVFNLALRLPGAREFANMSRAYAALDLPVTKVGEQWGRGDHYTH